ncbi:hypothetical protein [Mesorhizobium captivum]|uniref:hypothetical protein n=1 Tax=Mesorhizobium captivum TaxID=3072319 RepID=UPI002A240189|nr:hypothetical protein [Mesorhizobium sp. VK22E]MDX8507295.1 hypothetical protein [Mesorhizobium sp. VK22E]
MNASLLSDEDGFRKVLQTAALEGLQPEMTEAIETKASGRRGGFVTARTAPDLHFTAMCRLLESRKI